MSSKLLPLLAGALLALGLHTAYAQSLIVDTAAVDAALKRGAVVWDARDADDYAAGHIAGAVNFGAAGDLFRDANREDPPSAAVAAQLFGNAGIDFLNKEVIVYGGKGDPYAYFAARMLEYYGGKHAKVYHGGIDDWKSASKPLSTEPTKLPAVKLTLNAERVVFITTRSSIPASTVRSPRVALTVATRVPSPLRTKASGAGAPATSTGCQACSRTLTVARSTWSNSRKWRASTVAYASTAPVRCSAAKA